MRSNVPSQFSDSVRKISARALVMNDHPEFEVFPALETNKQPFVQFDIDTISHFGGPNSIRLYGLITEDNYVRKSDVVIDPDNPGTRTFTSLMQLPAGAITSEEYRAIAAGENRFFCAKNGKVYYTTTFAGWAQLADLTDPVTGVVPKISLCAISPTDVVAAAVYSGVNVNDHCKISVINTNLTVDTWKGLLPKHTKKPNLAAYQDDASTVHIYVDNWNGKKPLYLRRFAWRIWSATKEILPMDALDDESSFSAGRVSEFSNGRVFLTGVLKRKYGPYAIYMQGLDKFTFGRDLVIKSDFNEPLKLFEDPGGAGVWAIGINNGYYSPKTGNIFTDDLETNEVKLHSFTADFLSNQSDRLTLDIPKRSFDEVAELAPGARLDLEVSANDSPYIIGRYGVDRVRKIENETGQSYLVDCSSHASKLLMDWESDTYFDYMGQGEDHGDPGDLTKLVRYSGSKFATTGGGLQLDSLNDTGLLYSTQPATHGGFMRCKFTNVQPEITMFGVGVNYGEESLAEAATRLGQKVEDITASERGRWGLFAIYIPDPIVAPNGEACVQLVDWNTIRRGTATDADDYNPYRVIKTVYLGRPQASGTAWLAIQYQDGYARVYYQDMDSPDMDLVISCEAQFEKDIHPSEHENYGRGALFMRNNSGYHMAYPVMTDSDVIPLYSSDEKYDRNGVPLEDRIDKFKSSNGTVLIDSEKIQYTGIAGWSTQRFTQDLTYVPGKVIARSVTSFADDPGGTEVVFAKDRTNNYVVQEFTVSATQLFNGVRFWAKKINYPEDGLELSLWSGTNVRDGNQAQPLGVRMASVSIPASSIKAEGGWITVQFSSWTKLVAGTKYRIILWRSKNHTHPSSTTWFATRAISAASYSGGDAYVFTEDDWVYHAETGRVEEDWMYPAGGDMPFQIYARIEGENKEFCFPVIYETGKGLPANGTNYFLNQAVTITQGGGKGNAFRIVRDYRFTDSLNDLYVFFIDKTPDRTIFDLKTKVRAVPAMYGLKRGQSSTLVAAHGDYSLVHNPAAGTCKAMYFEYYTADIDLTIAEVAEDLARKAGIVETDKRNRHSGMVAGAQYPNLTALEKVPAQSKNCIISLDLPYLGGDTDAACVGFWNDSDEIQMSVQFIVGVDYLGARYGFVQFLYYTAIGDTMQLMKLPFDENIKGSFRVSLYDGHLSAWCGDRILGGVHLGTNLKEWTLVGAWLTQQTPSGVMKVMIPQAGTRVNSFVMDMGKTGAQLLNSLIGEKRIYFHDDGAGRLKIYTDRESVPGPYTRVTAYSNEKTDIGLATRVLLEGGEVVEVSSAGNLQKYGNFFKTFNFSEINNLDDAEYFANLVLEDMSLNRERVEIDGAADLRVEPSDEFTFYNAESEARVAVVDSVTYAMHLDEAEAVLDMRLSGRLQPDGYGLPEG